MLRRCLARFPGQSHSICSLSRVDGTVHRAWTESRRHSSSQPGHPPRSPPDSPPAANLNFGANGTPNTKAKAGKTRDANTHLSYLEALQLSAFDSHLPSGDFDSVSRLNVDMRRPEDGVRRSPLTSDTDSEQEDPFPLQQETPLLTVVKLTRQGLGVCVGESSSTSTILLLAPTVCVGERVLLKPYSYFAYPENDTIRLAMCDLIRVVEPNTADRVQPRCKLHERCSSCSFQHLEYTKQLDHKMKYVRKDFEKLVGPAGTQQILQPFEPSPAIYGFRTKMTPHHGNLHAREPLQKLGFLERGRLRSIVDVDECPVVTDAVNAGLRQIRLREIGSVSNQSRRMGTFHIRQQLLDKGSIKPELQPLPKATGKTMELSDFVKQVKAASSQVSNSLSSSHQKTLMESLNLTPSTEMQPYPPAHLTARPVLDTKSVILDTVNGHIFRTPSNSFFQNNSHILPSLVHHVSTQLQRHPTPTLIDAYCGTGLFAITQSHHFTDVIGIELDTNSIAWARRNASDNGVRNARFVSGDVRDLFAGVEAMVAQQRDFHGLPSLAHTGDAVSLIIDPPKAGCGEEFLVQMMRLNPRVIVYVSCNSETQVRDLARLEEIARMGVPPASFRGSVGKIVAGEREAGRVNAGLNQSRVLYLGGKKLVRDSKEFMHVDDEAENRASVRVENIDDAAAIRREAGIKSGVVEPSTLLKVKAYKVVEVKPFDMFPHSWRSEVVATLIREDVLEEEGKNVE
ncbi:S-adenosyl-L-methionine-dependent methyltransferase [Chytriomyces sp. MP71]|nr:S-adenosyl-L-methionine-dependent methyltransferase [Chytriomyces sp. MP71]